MFMSDISIVVRKMRVFAEHNNAANGLGFPEQVVLMYLKANGPCSQAEIASALDIDKGAITKTLTKLEDKQLVTRRINETNRRQKLVTLLPAGLEIMQALAASYQDLEALLFAGMSQQEKAQAVEAFAKIATNASQIKEG